MTDETGVSGVGNEEQEVVVDLEDDNGLCHQTVGEGPVARSEGNARAALYGKEGHPIAKGGRATMIFLKLTSAMGMEHYRKKYIENLSKGHSSHCHT